MTWGHSVCPSRIVYVHNGIQCSLTHNAGFWVAGELATVVTFLNVKSTGWKKQTENWSVYIHWQQGRAYLLMADLLGRITGMLHVNVKSDYR